MANLKDAEKQVTIVENRTLTGGGRDDWNRYHRIDRRIHRVALSNMDAITDLHANTFSIT